MTYGEVIDLCVAKFNQVFGTEYHVEYNTREHILNANPHFKIGEKAAGVYDTKTKKQYFFSDMIEKIREKNYNNSQGSYDNGLTFLIRAVFHELEHTLQREHPDKLKNQFWYSKAMYDIEAIILAMRQIDPKIIDIDYRKLHDYFLMEIDADIKGINNAKSFVSHNGVARD